ncbi:MAG: proton-conducting transporter membrane subunit [Lachnospiraceae bacterium]
MNQSLNVLLPIFFPIIMGIGILILPKIEQNRKALLSVVGIVLVLNGLLVCRALLTEPVEVTLFYLTSQLPIYFKIDALGRIFAVIVTIVWIAVGFYSFIYMKREQSEKRYFGFYLIVFGVLIGLDFSGNLITMYLFYEFMTLVSMPLVIHSLTKEAIMAGLKYLFYSFCGAYMALFGLFFLNHYTNTLTFSPGGVLDMSLVQGHVGLILLVTFVMILGFGVKAGMFPLHGWLPTAHPVAPSPASAVLSGIIVKSGVFAMIRVVYYIIGADFIRDTWVQYVWLILTLLTVFMGSMLAYREPVMKKRLAYSTVSQVSYILFGLALLNPIGMTGALLHVIFHAFIKSALFLIVGAIIYQTGKTKATELQGIGKEMPITMWCYTLLSLALIGIPPMSGFISKWYLGIGALQSGIPGFSWIGPVILLVSALLTAGYLMPITIQGFFPGEHYDYTKLKRKEPSLCMLLPIILLTGLAVLFGLMPNGLVSYITAITAQLM